MERMIIPTTVKVIGEWAFKDCSQLVNVGMREGLEQINSQAFECCTSLEQIIIPFAIEFIRYNTFRDCSRLMKWNYARGSSVLEVVHLKAAHRLNGSPSPQP